MNDEKLIYFMWLIWSTGIVMGIFIEKAFWISLEFIIKKAFKFIYFILGD